MDTFFGEFSRGRRVFAVLLWVASMLFVVPAWVASLWHSWVSKGSSGSIELSNQASMVVVVATLILVILIYLGLRWLSYWDSRRHQSPTPLVEDRPEREGWLPSKDWRDRYKSSPA